MGVSFSVDGGKVLHKGCFAYILYGLSEGHLERGDDEDEGEPAFVPDTITFHAASTHTLYGVANTTTPDEWDAFYADIHPTMEGVEEILSLEDMQRAGRKLDVTMNVAAEFGKDRSFLPMVLHLIRLPYAAPWVARMYKEIKDKWPQLSAVDCFQLACAVRPTLPDDKDERRVLQFHPRVYGCNGDMNRPFNALTDLRLGQTKLRSCPTRESFSVTQFSVKGGSSTTYVRELSLLTKLPEAGRWYQWAGKVITPKLTGEQRASAERDYQTAWGGSMHNIILRKYFGQADLGSITDGNFSLTCEQIIESVLAVFFGGKKK